MNFNERRKSDPQGCIDDLLKLLAKQNAEIAGQVKQAEKVKGDLQKAMTRLLFCTTPPGTAEQSSFDVLSNEEQLPGFDQ